MTHFKPQKNVANVRSQLNISFTANKVSEICVSSDFTKSPNLAKPTSPTILKQLFCNPVLLSAITKAEILFAMLSVISHFTHDSCNDLFRFIQVDVPR